MHSSAFMITFASQSQWLCWGERITKSVAQRHLMFRYRGRTIGWRSQSFVKVIEAATQRFVLE